MPERITVLIGAVASNFPARKTGETEQGRGGFFARPPLCQRVALVTSTSAVNRQTMQSDSSKPCAIWPERVAVFALEISLPASEARWKCVTRAPL